jgi:hypothetical protein
VLKSLRRCDNSASADNIVYKINEEKDDELPAFLKPALPNKPQLKIPASRAVPSSAGPVSSSVQRIPASRATKFSESNTNSNNFYSDSKNNCGPKLKNTSNINVNNTISSDSRASILEISSAIESTIITLKTTPTQSSVAIMQLCDNIRFSYSKYRVNPLRIT